MNIKRQIRNIIFENLNSENTSTDHTNYKFDTSEVDTENQDLTFKLVILGVAAAILSMLYCICKLRKSLVCCTFYEFTSFMFPCLTRIISSNENAELFSVVPSTSQNFKESPSCIQLTYPEYRTTITQTSDHTSSSSSSSGSVWKLRRFMINSEVVYGYILNPPYQTIRTKPEHKRLSDRHSI